MNPGNYWIPLIYRLLGQSTKQPLSNFEPLKFWKQKQLWELRLDFEKWRTIGVNVCGMLVWVVLVVCLRGRCGWRACVGNVLQSVTKIMGKAAIWTISRFYSLPHIHKINLLLKNRLTAVILFIDEKNSKNLVRQEKLYLFNHTTWLLLLFNVNFFCYN